MQKKESIRGRIAYPICQTHSYRRGMTLWTRKRERKWTLLGEIEDLALRKLVRPLILAPGNWMRTLSASLPAQCATEEEPYLRRKGSGQLFFNRTKEDLFQQPSPKWSQDWWAIMAKKNDNLMQQFIGHDKAEIAESVRKTWSTRFLRNRLASTHPWMK